MTMFSEVSAMNLAFNNAFGGATLTRVAKQCANLNDEYNELLVAHTAQDEIQVRDACCDLLVFALGAFHLMGINYDTDLADHPRTLYLREGILLEQLDNAIGTFPAMYEELQLALAAGMDASIIQNLLKIIDLALGLYNLFGYTDLVEQDMHAVYVSNMSKFCADQDVLDATVLKYESLGLIVRSEGEFPTMCVKSQIDQEIDGENYPEGKFLKSTTYQAPVLV